VIAADTEPLEIVLHLPLLCEEKVSFQLATFTLLKNVPYIYVSSKQELGAICGTSRNVIAVAIIKNKLSALNNTIYSLRDEIEKFFIGGADEMADIDEI